MPRRGIATRKLGRERDQRRALIKGLATALIEQEKITTTMPKAKELLPYVEGLITKAKQGGLHNRRQVLADVTTVAMGHKLVDVIAPKLKGRTSGHLRIKPAGNRVGDNAPMATVSFVDDLKAEVPAAKKPATSPAVQWGQRSAKKVDKKAEEKKS